jgi:hypothetical protein
MMDIGLPSNRIFLTIRLIFWRFASFVVQNAILLKPKMGPILPFMPLLGYGSLAYLLGWLVGELIRSLAG